MPRSGVDSRKDGASRPSRTSRRRRRHRTDEAEHGGAEVSSCQTSCRFSVGGAIALPEGSSSEEKGRAGENHAAALHAMHCVTGGTIALPWGPSCKEEGRGGENHEAALHAMHCVTGGAIVLPEGPSSKEEGRGGENHEAALHAMHCVTDDATATLGFPVSHELCGQGGLSSSATCQDATHNYGSAAPRWRRIVRQVSGRSESGWM